MSESIDPSEFVDESFVEDTGSIESAEAIGPEPAPAARRGLLDMLLTTEAPPELTPSGVEMDYSLSKGKALILYGVVQAAGTGGMPAVGNIVLGSFIEIRDRSSIGSEDRDDQDDQDDQDVFDSDGLPDGVPAE